MQRKQILYLLAIMALLISSLPAVVSADYSASPVSTAATAAGPSQQAPGAPEGQKVGSQPPVYPVQVNLADLLGSQPAGVTSALPYRYRASDAVVADLTTQALAMGPSANVQSSGSGHAPDPFGVSFDGMDESECCGGAGNVTPPDSDLAAGPNHLIAVVNTAIEVYDKTGASLAGPVTLDAFFAPLGGGCAADPFDPTVVYDEEADRWLIGADGDGTTFCEAASQTGDPTGVWNLYAVPAQPVGGEFHDYPHQGVGDSYIVVGANQFDGAIPGGFEGRVWALDKAVMYTGGALSVVTASTGGTEGTPQPLNLHGWNQGTWPAYGSTHYFITDPYDGCTTNIWQWNIPNPPSIIATTDLCAATGVASGQPVDAPQLGGGAIQANDWRMRGFEYRNGAAWSTDSIACNPGGGTVDCVRWHEYDMNAGATLVQAGVYGTDGEFRTFPDLAVNQCGDMAVGYNVLTSQSYPSVYVNGRLSTDPPGTLQSETLLKAGEVTFASFDGAPYRWGDYASTAIDPDGVTFWQMGEYSKDIATISNWGNWVGSWTYPACGQTAPSISLVKTVGTDSSVCATTDEITVYPGTEVYYCYEVTNTGNVTLNLHDLVDDQLGTIFTGLSYELTPGSSVNTVDAGLTISAIVNTTTVNTATWTAYNEDSPSATASATATVIVEDMPGVRLCSTPNLPIPDYNGTPGMVSDTISVGADATIVDFNVFLDVPHTWVGDLKFTLQHVDTGTTVTLVDRPGSPPYSGCSYNDYFVTVDDEGLDTPIENQCASTPPAIAGVAPGGDPPGPVLSAFDGESTLGDWTLTVMDMNVYDTGTLVEWCVDVLPADIEINKTVGLDPATCAATDEITLPPGGGDVYYCYEVTNTGDVTLNLHDLTDSELGSIFSGLNYALDPGSSVNTVAAGLVISDTITTTTVNTAMWTAYNAGGPPVQASDTATVTVQVPAIALNKTVGTVPGVCAGTDNISVTAGTEVYYCYQVENTGDVEFNFHDLEDSELGVLLDNFPYTLAPGAFSPQVIVPDTPMMSVTNVATWTAYSSLAGYMVDDTIPYDFQDISGTGTAFTLGDDEVSGALPIGFDFDFFGLGYTDAYASSNGFLTFNNDTNSGCCTGLPIPTPGSPDNMIAGWWEDLDPGEAGSGLYYETLGAAPNRVFIVQFTDVQHFPSGNPATFQYKLFEGTNIVEVHYMAAPSDGSQHSAGIENIDGTVGMQYYLGTSGLTTPVAVQYAPEEAYSASFTDSATVTVLVPNIDVNPLTVQSSQDVNQIVTMPMTVANTGEGDLMWEIAEEPTGATAPEAQAPGDPALARDLIDPSDFKMQEQAQAPASLSDWRAPEAVLWDNGPLVTQPGGGAGGADASALQTALGMITYGAGHQLPLGYWIADDFTVGGSGWLIGNITFFAYQTGSTTTSTMTNVAWLLYDGQPGAGGSLIASGSGLSATGWTNIYRVLDTDLLNTQRPIMYDTVDTGGLFLPAGTYWIAWQTDGTLASGPWAPPVTVLGSTGTGNGLQSLDNGATWAPVVDVGPQDFPFIIEGLTECSKLADVSWLSTDPITGTNGGGTSTPVDVTFDSTGLAYGVYTANLCITSNDPDPGPGNETQLVIVPVTLTLQPPTAVALTELAAGIEQLPAPLTGLPLATLPAAAAAALGAAFVWRRKRD